jgi:hypothetical protein
MNNVGAPIIQPVHLPSDITSTLKVSSYEVRDASAQLMRDSGLASLSQCNTFQSDGKEQETALGPRINAPTSRQYVP